MSKLGEGKNQLKHQKYQSRVQAVFGHPPSILEILALLCHGTGRWPEIDPEFEIIAKEYKNNVLAVFGFPSLGFDYFGSPPSRDR